MPLARHPRARHPRGIRLLRDRRGASAVEFAMTAPVLFLMISGTLDMAQGYFVNTVLQGAVNAAARKSSLQTGQTASATLDTLVSSMIKNAMPKATVTFVRKNYAEFSAVGMPEDFTDTNKNGKYDAAECFVDMNSNALWDADMGQTGLGGANDVVVYTVTVNYKRMFGFGSYLGLPLNQAIRATTILKNQPFATQSSRTGTSICP
ncbi:MAG: TadE/TadG family type IV pilus assembly protein [Novosphingobium sp.]